MSKTAQKYVQFVQDCLKISTKCVTYTKLTQKLCYLHNIDSNTALFLLIFDLILTENYSNVTKK
jgi:hypothetical protein